MNVQLLYLFSIIATKLLAAKLKGPSVPCFVVIEIASKAVFDY